MRHIQHIISCVAVSKVIECPELASGSIEITGITINEIAKQINKGVTSTKEKIRKLKKQNKIKRVGPDKGGYWEVINNDEN